jgi:translation initiation factor IF-3
MITADPIRLIGSDGEMVGVVGIQEAISKAAEAGLDLVEISPNAEPPVCKILDYGKYKYEQQKKANEAKKKQKVVEVKELKLRPTIEKHDFEVKLKKARKFIEDGNKVKFTLRFRGREMSHIELGMNVLKQYQTELEDIAKAELEPKTEGRQMIMILGPETA